MQLQVCSVRPGTHWCRENSVHPTQNEPLCCVDLWLIVLLSIDNMSILLNIRIKESHSLQILHSRLHSTLLPSAMWLNYNHYYHLHNYDIHKLHSVGKLEYGTENKPNLLILVKCYFTKYNKPEMFYMTAPSLTIVQYHIKLCYYDNIWWNNIS